MGGLWWLGEREGLFRGVTVCMFVWPTLCVSVKSNLSGRLFILMFPYSTTSIISKDTQLSFYLYMNMYACITFPVEGIRWGVTVYIGSIVTMCDLNLHSLSYFQGNHCTNRSNDDLSIISAATLEDKVSQSHLRGSDWMPHSPYAWSGPCILNAQCSCGRLSTHRLQILWNSKWITLSGFTDELVVNHTHTPSSGDFLFWFRGPLGSPHAQTCIINHFVLLPSMKNHISSVYDSYVRITVRNTKHSLHVTLKQSLAGTTKPAIMMKTIKYCKQSLEHLSPTVTTLCKRW